MKYADLGLITEFVGENESDPSITQRVIAGQVQLVFITPENLLLNRKFREMLCQQVYQQNLVGLVVDEAHCIKSVFRNWNFEELITVKCKYIGSNCYCYS